MEVGDRLLVKKWLGKEIFKVARVDVPHSSEKAFVTKSGGDFTIGHKVWKSNYVWNEKNQMWIPKR